MKKKVFFIIHTEYHLMEAVSYILNNFPRNLYESYIFRLSNGRGRLDRFNLNIDKLPAIYNEFIYSYCYKPSLEMKSYLDGIVRLEPEITVVFDDANYWTSYFLRQLNRNGCRICLAPDGANVYFPNKLPPLTIIKRFFQSALYRYTHLLIPPYIPFVHHGYYAFNKYIDEIWAEYPEYTENRKNRYCREMKILNTSFIIQTVNGIFNFKGFPEGMKNDRVIIFFDAPLEDSVIDISVKMLKKLQNKNPSYPIYVKLHPSSSNNTSKKYDAILGVKFLPMDYPAELYIQNISNSILISVISTVMLCYNSTCKYYWIYPMTGGVFLGDHHCNPTSYIKEVKHFDEIEL